MSGTDDTSAPGRDAGLDPRAGERETPRESAVPRSEVDMSIARHLAAGATIACLLLLAVAPAGAVVDGQEDTANTYDNVGNWQLQIEGQWFGFCSGTLVADGVVLTAAHCMDFFGVPGGLPIEDLRITFDPTPGADSTYYGVERIVVHPDWAERPVLKGNSKH